MAHTREWKEGDKTMVFIPFPRANSREALESTLGRKNNIFGIETTEEEGWNQYKTDVFGQKILGIKFTDKEVFCADDLNRAAKLQELKNQNDMLYLRGHCSAGEWRLTSPDRQLHVAADQILALLQGALSTDFKGIIKVYSCHSGSTGYDSYLGWIPYQSFAQRLADVMYDAGYKKCRFYGYTAKLTTWRDVKTLGGKLRKGAVGEDKKTILGLANSRRIEITPTNKS